MYGTQDLMSNMETVLHYQRKLIAVLFIVVSFCALAESGCAASATQRDVVDGRIYACPGTIANGGTRGSAAAALCGAGYHVCQSAQEATDLGLTSALCRAVAVSDSEFFGTQETSYGAWQCESLYGNPQNKADDVWGCAASTATDNGDMITQSDPCLSLNTLIGNFDWIYWQKGTDEAGNAFTMSTEVDSYKLVDKAGGGVLCCVDETPSPTASPSRPPSDHPTGSPTAPPSISPTQSEHPSLSPSRGPSAAPSTSSPSASPTMHLSAPPTSTADERVAESSSTTHTTEQDEQPASNASDHSPSAALLITVGTAIGAFFVINLILCIVYLVVRAKRAAQEEKAVVISVRSTNDAEARRQPPEMQEAVAVDDQRAVELASSPLEQAVIAEGVPDLQHIGVQTEAKQDDEDDEDGENESETMETQEFEQMFENDHQQQTPAAITTRGETQTAGTNQ